MAVIKSSTIAALLVVAILSSLSPRYEAGGCLGKPCPEPPPKQNCFSAYSVEHCDRQGCGYTCSEHGFREGGWCEDRRMTSALCCCRY
ncbi:hypothetical protein BDA96_05G159300 [Sorghum bicolor]|uniref:Knottin scorpion toxin-like domain-containing protein n=2 Tax=Sorghum bicolor TaxID=4558 RepID=A0A921UGQ4_SORBI|nr:hypothetical protein BDA96_05G159300 [Sorghum bicolor]KXG28634.1 hypothetical protein SORBI_3005G146000 [Sorghum bicolor]